MPVSRATAPLRSWPSSRSARSPRRSSWSGSSPSWCSFPAGAERSPPASCSRPVRSPGSGSRGPTGSSSSSSIQPRRGSCLRATCCSSPSLPFARRAVSRAREPEPALIAVARPLVASHSTSTPSIRTPPVATSKRTGIPVRMRCVASSALTPITESCGPVMPTSVIAAVPPGCTRASAVCTWVCVPITAVTRPSSQRARATFSLVASAWTSTSTTGVVSRASSTSSSTTSHMLPAGCSEREPITLTTPTCVPSPAVTIGDPAARGRRPRGSPAGSRGRRSRGRARSPGGARCGCRA